MINKDWRNATPEQLHFWNIASAKIAYTTIIPLCYEGELTGSEFLTYNAGKLYLALQMACGVNVGAGVNIDLYDESNTLCGDFVCSTNLMLGMVVYNAYFGRLTISAGLPKIHFIGYRLTV